MIFIYKKLTLIFKTPINTKIFQRPMKKKIIASNKYQKSYTYYLTEPIGKNFDPDFKPELTPKQMLKIGVFGGCYLRRFQKNFQKIGLRTQNYQKRQIQILIFLASKHHSHTKSGLKKDGYITKIHTAGFNGTAGITWVVDVKMMLVKLNDGKPLRVMQAKLKKIVEKVIFSVGQNKDKHYYIGRTIVGRCRKSIRCHIKDFVLFQVNNVRVFLQMH